MCAAQTRCAMRSVLEYLTTDQPLLPGAGRHDVVVVTSIFMAPEVEHPVVVRDPVRVKSCDGVVAVKGREATPAARGWVAEV